MYAFSSYRCESLHIAAFMSSIDVHTGMFTDVLMAFMFTLIPANFLISVFCIVVAGQPVCDVHIWARLIYDAHPVLVYSQHNAS